MVNADLLPISLRNKPWGYMLIQKFCSDRVLMLNRAYCKEILIACNIEDWLKYGGHLRPPKKSD